MKTEERTHNTGWHTSSRIRLWLDGLIVLTLAAACAGILILGRLRSETQRWMSQDPAAVQAAGERIAAEAVDQYRLPADHDAMDLLNGKLTAAGLAGAVMELTPGSPVGDGDLRGYPVRLRLAPVPGQRLAGLLNAIEYDSPRFMIVSLQLTRIRSGDDAVDVVIELTGFR